MVNFLTIVVYLVIVLAIVILIGNAIYINEVRRKIESTGLSYGGAMTFFIADIILVVLLVIFLVYLIFRAIVPQRKRDEWSDKRSRALSKFYSSK